MRYNDNKKFNRLYCKVNMAIARDKFDSDTATELELLMADYIKHKNDYIKSANYLKAQILVQLMCNN